MPDSPTTTPQPNPHVVAGAGTADIRSMQDRIAEVGSARDKALQGGGPDRIAKHHAAGALTARERIAALLDPHSFMERYALAQHRCTHFGMASKQMPGDGVVTGAGTVDGRIVHVASQDFTVGGGALGEVHGHKIIEAMSASLRTGAPFVFINDSGGARIQEGIDSLAAYGRVFYHNTLLSGVVPQISLICGPCAGGAAYSPAMTDFIIQTRKAQMFITGPQVIKQVTHEDISAEQLGGADAHMRYSGNIHFIAEDDAHAANVCRRLLSFLPMHNAQEPPRLPFAGPVGRVDALDTMLPDDPRRTYDMKRVIHALVDNDDFLEVQSGFASNIVVGLGRLAGRTIGIVANNPSVKAGALDIDSSDKGAGFVRFCNAFNIPLVTLVDTPGYFPGVQQEHAGIIRHGAKLLFAYSASTVPKITIVVRKAFGGAYVAMSSKELGADAVAAWPTAEIAVMGAEGAAEVIFRSEIAAAADKAAKRKELVDLYRRTFSTPLVAAGRCMVDDIIEPSDTRRFIAHALDMFANKRELRPEKKHGLIPL